MHQLETLVTVSVVASVLFNLILLALVSRVSMWAHATQEKLEMTNKILNQIMLAGTTPQGAPPPATR